MIYLLEHAKNGLRGETMERKRADGYQLLSQYRSELMGIAMLWVMLFHAYEFHFGVPALDAVKQLGFGGVDMLFCCQGWVCTAPLCAGEKPFRSISCAAVKGSFRLTGW